MLGWFSFSQFKNFYLGVLEKIVFIESGKCCGLALNLKKICHLRFFLRKWGFVTSNELFVLAVVFFLQTNLIF